MSARHMAALVVIVGALTCARDTHAQGAGSTPGRFEVSVGGLWIGQQPLGETAANQTTGTGTSLRIFTSSSDLASGTAVEGRVAVRLLRSLEADVQGSYATPRLKITLGNDIESAPPITAIETIQQVTLGAGIVWYVPMRLLTPRLTPFATAGGGYLRQVHEAGTLIEIGRFYQFGGGVKYVLFERQRGFVNALGARVDVRAVLRAQGVAFDEGRHASPALGVSAFVRF
jgi:hypothetical protein